MAKPVGRDPHALYCDEPSLTKQSFVDECDINQIIERARNGADISHLNARSPQFGDFSNIPDYRSACDVVNRANSMFMELDARVRERFANDPGRMLEFMRDPANREDCVKLGLFEAPKPIPPVKDSKAPAVDPGASADVSADAIKGGKPAKS
jgi:phage internal scaffolding protein